MRRHFERTFVAAAISGLALGLGAPAAFACQPVTSSLAFSSDQAVFDPVVRSVQAIDATMTVTVQGQARQSCRLTALFTGPAGAPTTAVTVGAVTLTPAVTTGTAVTSAAQAGTGLGWVRATIGSAGSATLIMKWRITLSVATPWPPAQNVLQPIGMLWAIDTSQTTPPPLPSPGTLAQTPLRVIVPPRATFSLLPDCGNPAGTDVRFASLTAGLGSCVGLIVEGNADAQISIASTNAGRLIHETIPTSYATYRTIAQFPDLRSTTIFDGDAQTSSASFVVPSGSRNRLVFALLNTSAAKAAGVYRDTITVTLSAP